MNSPVDLSSLSAEEKTKHIMRLVTSWSRRAARLQKACNQSDLATISKEMAGELDQRAKDLIAEWDGLEPHALEYENDPNCTDALSQAEDDQISLDRIRIGISGRLHPPAPSPPKTPATMYVRNTPDPSPPIFDGSREKWNSWWSYFQQMVHNSPHLSEHHKHQVLVKALTGEARRTIGEPLWTAGSYNKTLEKLKKAYENTARDRELFKRKVEMVPAPKDSGKDLRRFLQDWRNAEEAYESVAGHGLTPELRDHIFLPKIPDEILQAIYDRKRASDISVDDLIEDLEITASNWERVKTHRLALTTTASSNKPQTPNATANTPQQPHKPATAQTQAKKPPSNSQPPSAFVPTASRNNNQTELRTTPNSCIFCAGDHRPSFCPTYPDVPRRLARLGELRRCTICLSPRHLQGQCTFSEGCLRCGEQHKQPVCPKAIPVASQMMGTSYQNPIPTQGHPSNHHPLQPYPPQYPPSFYPTQPSRFLPSSQPYYPYYPPAVPQPAPPGTKAITLSEANAPSTGSSVTHAPLGQPHAATVNQVVCSPIANGTTSVPSSLPSTVVPPVTVPTSVGTGNPYFPEVPIQTLASMVMVGQPTSGPSQSVSIATGTHPSLPPSQSFQPLTTVPKSPSYTPVALPTFQATLGKGECSFKSRVLLDSGSQRSFIHPSVVEELNLTPKGCLFLAIDTFAKENPAQSYDVVEFDLQLGSQHYLVEAVVHPMANNHLHIPGYKRAVQTLKSHGVQVLDNDPSDELTGIQIILGSDYLPVIFQHTARHLEVQLFATAGGYVLWGRLPAWTNQSEQPRPYVMDPSPGSKPPDGSVLTSTPIIDSVKSPVHRVSDRKPDDAAPAPPLKLESEPPVSSLTALVPKPELPVVSIHSHLPTIDSLKPSLHVFDRKPDDTVPAPSRKPEPEPEPPESISAVQITESESPDGIVSSSKPLIGSQQHVVSSVSNKELCDTHHSHPKPGPEPPGTLPAAPAPEESLPGDSGFITPTLVIGSPEPPDTSVSDRKPDDTNPKSFQLETKTPETDPNHQSKSRENPILHWELNLERADTLPLAGTEPERPNLPAGSASLLPVVEDSLIPLTDAPPDATEPTSAETLGLPPQDEVLLKLALLQISLLLCYCTYII